MCHTHPCRSGLQSAVKTLPKVHRNWTREKTLARIKHEARLLQQLQCVDGVVRMRDFYEEDDCVHLVGEVCWGGDLQAFALKRGCLNEASLARVASEVLCIIRGFHDAGYLHGDVKPGNFVCVVPCRDLGEELPNQGLKAVDLGCAHPMGNQRLTKQMGTPLFMAPEVFTGNFSYKADIWAVGVSLYWLFSGQYPCCERVDLYNTPLEEITHAIRTCDVRFVGEEWRSMSPDGLDFMRRCLERNEATRIDAAEALAHPWLQRLGMRTHSPRACLASLDDEFFM
eukprot:193329-Chlamydomonas_euryale.AAC.1